MVFIAQVNDITQAIQICAQIFLENWSGDTIQMIELIDNFTHAKGLKISQILFEYFRQLHLTQVNT